MNEHTKMPVVFTGHGSPLNAIGDNRARRSWKAMGEQLGKPKVIVAVSAHWATEGTRVRTNADNPQINDMYGFPDELYQVHYEPAGNPEVADRVLELLGSDACADDTWGIDHGAWSVLSNMYPNADVPVVMVSTDMTATPEGEFEIGRRLAPLREEGAMIVASGNVVHNLRKVKWDMEEGADWANAFDEAVRDAILTGSFDVPVSYHQLPDATKAVPAVDHYYPLLVALGAASPEDKATAWNEYRELSSMSMTSYLFE